MANMSEIAKAMFQYRNQWETISDKDKEMNAFIFNRYFSKNYPEKAAQLNTKGCDKVTIMNLWFHFMKTESYPGWFWKGSTKRKMDIPEKDFKMLMKKLTMDKPSDLEFMLEHYPDVIKEELKYYKKKK